jgi:hypothetical protein
MENSGSHYHPAFPDPLHVPGSGTMRALFLARVLVRFSAATLVSPVIPKDLQVTAYLLSQPVAQLNRSQTVNNVRVD